MAKIYDLVEQTSTTTGTAAYDMTGTVTGRRAFSILTGGDVVPYAAVDDAGGYELGLGSWTGTPKKLSRTLVLSSSNANAAVSWAAGTRRVYITPNAALLGLSAARHNIGVSGSAPSTTDDSADGYDYGSVWVTTGGAIYFCSDPTASAAVWARVLAPEGGSPGSKVVLPAAFLEHDGSGTAYSTRGYLFGSDGANNFGFSNLGAWGAQTSDATPTNLVSKPGTNAVIDRSSGNGIVALKALVCAAENTAAGDRKAWEVTCAISQVSGTITVGTATKTELLETAGATAWEVSVVADSGQVYIQVTGEAATDINWHATFLTATTNIESF